MTTSARFVERPKAPLADVFSFSSDYIQAVRCVAGHSNVGYLEFEDRGCYGAVTVRFSGSVVDDVFPSSHLILRPSTTGAAHRFLEALGCWATKMGTFMNIRLGPYVPTQTALSLIKASETNANVAIEPYDQMVDVDLTGGRDRILRGFTRQGRANLRKARESRLRFEMAFVSSASLSEFMTLYWSTMRRLNAEPMYRFPPEYFESVFALQYRRMLTARVSTPDGHLCASGLWIPVGDGHDYFLVGSDSQYWAYRPNNLLCSESMFALAERGSRFFVMGGGEAPLKRFKQSFTKRTRTCYKLVTRTAAPE